MQYATVTVTGKVDSPTSPAQRARGPGRSALTGVFGLLWCLLAISAAAAQPYDEETQGLLVAAVEAAFELDLHNSRCRTDRSGKRTGDLNKVLASRFRLTVLDVQDDYFPEGYYRDAQARMQREFQEKLKQHGGCGGAKTSGWRIELGERYKAALLALDDLP